MLNTQRAIAILQAVGACSFFWMMIPALGGGVGILFFLLVAFSIFSIISSVSLWRGRAFGISSGLLIQALQIPVVFSSRFDYQLVSGLGVIIGTGPAEHFNRLAKLAEFDFKWITGFPNPGDGAPFGIGINLVALAAFIWLLKRRLASRPRSASSSARSVEKSAEISEIRGF